MNPIKWIALKIAQRKAEKQMGNLLSKLDGYKTYVTLVLGAVIAIVGHFWGPLHVGPIDIPIVDSKSMWEVVWAAMTGIFMRHGITKSGPTPPAA